MTTFSAQSWKSGYGGWSLYFAPEIVQAVVSFAAGLPAAGADPDQACREICGLLRGIESREPEQLVFPDAVEKGSSEFRRSDALPVAVLVLSGWIDCPCCDMRFKVSDPRRWDGEQHTTCGQRIILSRLNDNPLNI